MVALALAEALKDAGYLIVGPFSTVGAALAAVRAEARVEALLDIWTGKEAGFELADELATPCIPFGFLLGRQQLRYLPSTGTGT